MAVCHGALRPHTPAPNLRHKVYGLGPRCLTVKRLLHCIKLERT